jgi:hypothetical protein
MIPWPCCMITEIKLLGRVNGGKFGYYQLTKKDTTPCTYYIPVEDL